MHVQANLSSGSQGFTKNKGKIGRIVTKPQAIIHQYTLKQAHSYL